MNILVFGDQTVDPHKFLLDALLLKEKPFLTNFLQRTHVALRAETRSLPRHRRDSIPAFSNIHELTISYIGSNIRDPAIDSSLLCIAQLSHWIGLHEERPFEYPIPEDTHILGICTGQLATSAIASCSSLNALSFSS